jgi:hypothetical protein
MATPKRSKEIFAGKTFTADDGGIRVTVIRVGGESERARFGVENLKEDRATYTITIHRKSGTDSDLIDYKTDDPPTDRQFESSADKTTGVSIRHVPG